jgi:hypothetical protein
MRAKPKSSQEGWLNGRSGSVFFPGELLHEASSIAAGITSLVLDKRECSYRIAPTRGRQISLAAARVAGFGWYVFVRSNALCCR